MVLKIWIPVLTSNGTIAWNLRMGKTCPIIDRSKLPAADNVRRGGQSEAKRFQRYVYLLSLNVT
jgi:hypothetical protein